ncbi:MAG: HEAT repeat domain-containing protein [Planctomycetota bacterium]
MTRSLLLVPAALLLLAAAARADTLTLTDGTVLEGRVVEGQDQVELYVRGQRQVFPRARVAKVETTRQAFAARLAQLDARDLRACLDLVAWCEEQRLTREARQVREKLLEQHPDHVATRRALDHVRHQGRWLTREQYMQALGLVKSADGRSWVAPEKRAAQDDAAAARDQEPEVEALLRRVATDGAEKVEPALARYPTAAVLRPLVSALRGGETRETRRLAARELGRRKAQAAEAELARTAVDDARHEVRNAALDALAQTGVGTRTHDELIRGLSHPSVFGKAHAADALARFPARRAIPVLITKLIETTGGFGRVSITIKTDRAYISDYQLTSGGNGQTAAEVADPTVSRSTEGVSLEVKVIAWYRERIVSALHSATGQSFGDDAGAWRRWWKAHEQDGE